MVFIPVSPWRVAHTQTGRSVYLSTMSVLAEGVIWSFVLSYPPRTGVFSGRNLAYVFQQYTEAYPLAGSLTLVVFVLEISYGRLCGSINSGNRQATGPLRFWLYTFRDHTTVM